MPDEESHSGMNLERRGPQAHLSLRRVAAFFFWCVGAFHLGIGVFMGFNGELREDGHFIALAVFLGLVFIVVGFIFNKSDDAQQEMNPDKYAPWKSYEE